MANIKTALVLPDVPQDTITHDEPSQPQQKQVWKKNLTGGSPFYIPPLNLSKAEAIQSHRLLKEKRASKSAATVPLGSEPPLFDQRGPVKVATQPGPQKQEAFTAGVAFHNAAQEGRVSANMAGTHQSDLKPVYRAPAGSLSGGYIVSGNAASLPETGHVWPGSVASSNLPQILMMPEVVKGTSAPGDTGSRMGLPIENGKVPHYPCLPEQHFSSFHPNVTKGTTRKLPDSAGFVPQQAVVTCSLAGSSPNTSVTQMKLHRRSGNITATPEDLSILAVDTARTQRLADSSKCCAGSPCVTWFAASTSPAQKTTVEAHRTKTQERVSLPRGGKQGGKEVEGIISRLSHSLMSIVYPSESSAALKPLMYHQPPLTGDRMSARVVGGSRKISHVSTSSAPSANRLEKLSADGAYPSFASYISPYISGTSAVPTLMYPPDATSSAPGVPHPQAPGTASLLPTLLPQSFSPPGKPDDSEGRSLYLTRGGIYYPYSDSRSAPPYRIPSVPTAGTAPPAGFLWLAQQPQQPGPQTRELKEQYHHVQDHFRRENEDLRTENVRLQTTLGSIQSRVNCILDELRDIKAKGKGAEGSGLTEAHRELAEKCTTMLGQLLTEQLSENKPAQPIGPLSLLSSFTEAQLNQLLAMEKPFAGSAAPAAPASAALSCPRLPAREVSVLPPQPRPPIEQDSLRGRAAVVTETGGATIGTPGTLFAEVPLAAKTAVATKSTPPPKAALGKTVPATDVGAADDAAAAVPAIDALPTKKAATAVAAATRGGAAALSPAPRAPTTKRLDAETDTKTCDARAARMLISAGGPENKDLADQARRSAEFSQGGRMLNIEDTGYIQVPIRTAAALKTSENFTTKENKVQENERKGRMAGAEDNAHVVTPQVKQIPAGKASKEKGAGDVPAVMPTGGEDRVLLKSAPAKDRASDRGAVPQKVGAIPLDRDIAEGTAVDETVAGLGQANQEKQLEENLQQLHASTGSFSGLFSLFFGAGSASGEQPGSGELSEATTTTAKPHASTEAAATSPPSSASLKGESAAASLPIYRKDATSSTETPVTTELSTEKGQRKATLSSKTVTQPITAKELPTARAGSKESSSSSFARVSTTPKTEITKELAAAPAAKKIQDSIIDAGEKERVPAVRASGERGEGTTESSLPERKETATKIASLPIDRTSSLEIMGKGASEANASQTGCMPTTKETKPDLLVVSKQMTPSQRSKEELGKEEKGFTPVSEVKRAEGTAAATPLKTTISAAAQTPTGGGPMQKFASLTRLSSKSASTPAKALKTPAPTVEAKSLLVRTEEKAALSAAAKVQASEVAAKSGEALAAQIQAKSSTANAELKSASASQTAEMHTPGVAKANAGEAKTGAAEVPGIVDVPQVTAKVVGALPAKMEGKSAVTKAQTKAALAAAGAKTEAAKILGPSKVPGAIAKSVTAAPLAEAEGKSPVVRLEEKAAPGAAAAAQEAMTGTVKGQGLVKVTGVTAKSVVAPATKVDTKVLTTKADAQSPQQSEAREKETLRSAADAGVAKMGGPVMTVGLVKVPQVTPKSVTTPHAKTEGKLPAAKADEKAAPSKTASAAEVKPVAAKTPGLKKIPGSATGPAVATKVAGPSAKTEAKLPAISETRETAAPSVTAPKAKTVARAETANGPVASKAETGAGTSKARVVPPAVPVGGSQGLIPAGDAPDTREKVTAGEAGKIASFVAAKKLPSASMKHPISAGVPLKAAAQTGAEDSNRTGVTGKASSNFSGSQRPAAAETGSNARDNDTSPLRAASLKGQGAEALAKRSSSAEQSLRARAAKGAAQELTPQEGLNEIPASVNAAGLVSDTCSGLDAARDHTATGSGLNKGKSNEVLRSGSLISRKESKNINLTKVLHPIETAQQQEKTTQGKPNTATDIKKINAPSLNEEDSAENKQFNARIQDSEEAKGGSEGMESSKTASVKNELSRGGSPQKPENQVMRMSSGNHAKESAPEKENREGGESEKPTKDGPAKLEERQSDSLPKKGVSGDEAGTGARTASENAATKKLKSVDEEGRPVRALSSGFSGFFYNLFGQPSETEAADAGTK